MKKDTWAMGPASGYKQLPLIHHQNVTCGVAFSPMALRRMHNTPQALGLLRLASDILLVIRKFAE